MLFFFITSFLFKDTVYRSKNLSISEYNVFTVAKPYSFLTQPHLASNNEKTLKSLKYLLNINNYCSTY